MNSWPLIASALAMGASGSLHCIAMCSALQRTVTGNRSTGGGASATCAGGTRRTAWFQAGRIFGYAALGAAAGVSGQWLLGAAEWQPLFQSTWAALNALLLVLGLSMLAFGRQPAWLEQLGAAAWQSVRPMTQPIAFVRSEASVGARAALGTGTGTGTGTGSVAPAVAPAVAHVPTTADRARSGASGASPVALLLRGAAWALLPCGLLYSALALAILASDPLQAAAVMTAFALGTTAGLTVFQSVFSRLPALARRAGRGALSNPASADRLAFRVNGVLLAAMAGIALVAAIGGHANPFCAT